MVQLMKKLLILSGMLYSLSNNPVTAQIKNSEEQITILDSIKKEKVHYAKELLDLEKEAGFNVQLSDYQTLDSIVNKLGKDIFFGGADENYKKIQAINNLKGIDLTLKNSNFSYKNEPELLFCESLKTKNLNSIHFLILYLEVASKKKFQIVPMKIGEHFFARYALDSLNFINWETTFGEEQPGELYKKFIKENKEIKPLTENEFLSGEYRAIGFFLNKTKQFKKSIEYFNKAIEIDSTNSRAYKLLGDSYNALGDKNNSLKNYSMAVGLDESFLDAYIARAEIFYKKKNLLEALKDYTKAIELAPENPEFYKIRGDIYRGDIYSPYSKKGDVWDGEKKPKLAQKDYEKALELILKK